MINPRVMKVFYGTDSLPYKDKELQVHYPIVGNAFSGASNTTEIRFYLPSEWQGATFVANTILPNGTKGSKLLETSSDDDGVYAYLLLTQWYTQYKGDLYISIQGYSGEINYVQDPETEIYTIYGTPTIVATGVIKLSIQFSTPFVGGEDETEMELIQRLLSIVANANAMGIFVVANISTADLSDYEVGKIIYDNATKQFYKKTSTSPYYERYDMVNDLHTIDSINSNDDLDINVANEIDINSGSAVSVNAEIFQFNDEDVDVDSLITLTNSSGILTNEQNNKALRYNSKVSLGGLLYNLSYIVGTKRYYVATPYQAVDVSGIYNKVNNYVEIDTSSKAYQVYSVLAFELLTASKTYQVFVEKEKTYIVLDSLQGGTLTTAQFNLIDVNTHEYLANTCIILNGNIYRLDSYNASTMTFVKEVFTSVASNELYVIKYYITINVSAKTYSWSTDAKNTYTKSYLDTLISTLKANSFQVVESLPAQGEEGIIYLIETSSGVYEQYIWEGNDYIDLGTTEIDLSGYLEKKTTNNTVYAINGSGSQIQLGYSSSVVNDNLVLRTSSGQVKVPSTPVDNNDAVSLYYFNYTLLTALSLKVDKTTTIAGISLTTNITSQALTDALVYMNNTTDIEYVMED